MFGCMYVYVSRYAYVCMYMGMFVYMSADYIFLILTGIVGYNIVIRFVSFFLILAFVARCIVFSSLYHVLMYIIYQKSRMRSF